MSSCRVSDDHVRTKYEEKHSLGITRQAIQNGVFISELMWLILGYLKNKVIFVHFPFCDLCCVIV